MNELERQMKRGDVDVVIDEVRSRLAEDRRAIADPEIGAWCGRRWRNLFMTAMERDSNAVKAATRLMGVLDKRSPRQRVAERFLVGEGCSEWSEQMPVAPMPRLERTTMIFAPGLLNGILPVRAFQEELPALCNGCRWPALRADAHPMRGCDANVADLLAAVERGVGLTPDGRPVDEADAVPPGDVFFLSYSKGAPDVLTLLARHPEIAARTRCVFTWAGAIGGSYVADDVYESIRELSFKRLGDAASTVIKLLAPMLDFEESSLRRLDEYDAKVAVRDLTRGHREAFLQEHAAALDALDVPIFSISGVTSPREVPAFQLQSYLQIAAREGDNDMQLSRRQATMSIPMAVHLGEVRGHHWDLSYGPFPAPMRAFSLALNHRFPRRAGLVAMVQLAAELGLID